MYLMFLGPFEEGGDFRDEGMSRLRWFVDKVWELVDHADRQTVVGNEITHAVLVRVNQTKKRVTERLETHYDNTAIAALMELLNTARACN